MTTRYVDELLLIPAGEHIQDWIDEHGMTITEFCGRMGLSRQSYNRIAKGEQPISLETAVALGRVTGTDAQFWLNLEALYRLEKRQLEERKKAEAEAKMIQEFLDRQPIRELVARGVFPKDMRKMPLSSQLSLVLNFYGVSDIASYKVTNDERRIAARSVKGTPSAPDGLTAWIHLAMMEVKQTEIQLPQYDENAFRRKLPEIVRLSEMLNRDGASVREYLLRLKEECASVGVSVVYVKKLNGVKRLNGVAFWVNGRRPAIALTLRNKNVDGILFSFLHEAGHILNDKSNLIYIADMDSESERNAEEFAAEMAIPQSENPEILRTNGRIERLKAVADRLHIALDVVIGRYRHLTQNFAFFSNFKPHSISWDEIGDWKLA